MKKFIWFFIGLLTIAVSYGAFQSGIITGTEFCVGPVCVSDWSVFSRSLPGRVVVSSNSSYTGIKQAVDWVNANATHPYEILIDAGNRDITDTITINTAGGYPISIRGLGFETTTLLASGGLEGKAMFDVQSSVEFSNFNMDASGLSGHGSTLGEDGFKVTATGNYIQIDNIGIYGFNKGISLETDSEMRVFNSSLEDNVVYGAYISGGDYRSAETDYNNSAMGVCLHAGSGKFFSTEHDSYLINSGQIGIHYEPATYTNYLDIAIFNDNFKNEVGGIIRSGFNFSLSRDANIEAYGNIGDEDHRPHAKINLVNGVTSQSLSATTWTKINYTLTDSYARKRGVTTTGRVTFLSDHTKSVQMWLSATVSSTTTPTDMQFAIIKNGNTAVRYGIMNVYLDASGRAFNFSQNIYLDDVVKNDYFELYMYAAGGGEAVTLKNLNWYIDSR